MEGGTPAFHTIPPTLLVQELVGIEIFCLSFWIKIIIFFHQGYHIVPVAWNIQPNFFLLIGSRESNIQSHLKDFFGLGLALIFVHRAANNISH